MRRTAVLLLLGVLTLHASTKLPAPATVLCLLCAGLFVCRWRSVRWLTVLTLGFCWAWLDAWQGLEDILPEALEGQEIEITGQVVSFPETTANGIRFLFAPDAGNGDRDHPSLVRLAWYDTIRHVEAGERWRLVVRLKRPRGLRNPGGFDYEGWLFRSGIRATGYVRRSEVNQRLKECRSVSGLCVRAAVDRAINESVGSYRSAGLISALAVGTRHRLGDHAWQVLAATGLSHLVAISGLHIGLVGGFGFLAVKKLLRHIVIPGPLQPIDIAAATALVLSAVYAALAGFSLPTSRALVMMAVVAVSVFLRREPAPDRILAAALIGALLVDPMAPLSAGFWLSFAAVGIIFFGTRLRSQRLSTIASLYRLQTRLFLMMAPLVLLLFDQVSLVGPFVNMIAIPLFSLVLIPLVLVATLLSGIVPGLSRLIWQICAATIDKIWPGLEWVAQTPVAQWQPADRPLALLALLMIGVVVLALPRGIPGRWLGILLCLPALQWQPVLPEPGAFRFTLLDVGQGLAAVVQTENHTLVYDTGPSYRDSHTARHTVLPYLESRGISRIDILMVSHLDKDHAGGMNYIRAAVPVTQLLVGLDAAASRSGTRCMAGMNWRWDEVAFTVLHPSTGTGWNRNNGSCVLRVAGRGGALLLTGDIEYKAESNLIKSALPLSADIIVVPHHGSRTSSTVGLINSVNARYALFSSGYRNRWGLPAGEIVRRWEDAGATTLVTWSSGAVEFLVDPDTGVGRPVEYRKINRRYWTAD